MEITLKPISFRDAWQSPKIESLKKKLKEGRKDIVDSFWKEIEKEGTPLFEPSDADT